MGGRYVVRDNMVYRRNMCMRECTETILVTWFCVEKIPWAI